MRILFHNWEYPPQGSGIGTYVYLLSEALRRAGHFVAVVTSRCSGKPEVENIDNGIVYRSYNLEEIGSPRVIDLICDLSGKHAIDLIEGADHLGESAGLIDCKDRPPINVKLHYNDVAGHLRYAHVHYRWQYLMIFLACLRQRKRIAAERSSMERADFVTAPSQAIVDAMRAEGVVLPQHVPILPNPVKAVYTETNNEADVPTLLFIGRMDFGKGLAHLPDILAGVYGRIPDFRLEIAGDDGFSRGIGSLKDWFQKENPNLEEQIYYLGHLDQHELDKAYRRAWVVVAPSNWDTFPNIVLEAMARSKPVVASNAGGIPEILAGTPNFSVKPSSGEFIEGICRFIKDRPLRLRAGKAGLEKVADQYSPEKTANEFVETMEEFLAGV